MHMHNHNDVEISSHEELVALVKYMLSHNISHTNELEQLASKLDNNENIHKAIESYNNGNDYLAKLLEEIGE